MATFMVERQLTGISMEQLAGAQKAAIETAPKHGARYIRSCFVPETQVCRCLFEGPDRATIELVQQAAGLPYVSVVEALDLAP